MKRIKLIALSLLLCHTSTFAWEINTHRAIDRCAIVEDPECGRGSVALNLHWFAESNIPRENGGFESYVNEKIDDYKVNDQETTYFNYILFGEKKGVSMWNQAFNKYDYVNLIEAGTILEDALYPNNMFSGDGRFNNHFYDPQNGGNGLTYGYGHRIDAITWGERTWSMGYIQNISNNYSYQDALEYYRKGFTESKAADRKKFRAKMFVSVGYLLHLLNDMNVPAHTRDDSHPFGDDFEKWMRGGEVGRDGAGFKIINTKLHSVHPAILNAVRNVSALKYDSMVNFQKFYDEQANFTARNFYSEDTISFNGGTFGGYGNYDPKSSDVTAYSGDETGYITSNSSEIASGFNRLAMMQKSSIPFKDYWYSMQIDGDSRVFLDNGVNLIPKAVANAEGFVNYFFRGRLKATLTDGNLTITNISDPNLVADASVAMFRSDGTMRVYYETDAKEVKFLKECPLDVPLEVNQEMVCDISAELESQQSDIGKEQKITVVFEGGTIGNEAGVSVAIVKKLANADLLFSFDKSGSMGSDIENAKNSAKSILDDIVGVENNSTFIEVEAFSYSADVLLPYDNNVTKAKNAITTLYSGGGTALYDAIAQAGNNAVAHKQESGVAKSIVILYTDGQENSSYTTRQNAVNAISNAYAFDIDEVFLIFVGSDTTGEAQLKSIAADAGRKFMSVSDASGLKEAIEKILQGQ